ncbi:glycosyltransferase family 2 protein [Lewinella sp. IMCC34183]|uniref:glycosyltransferase family 2 protein n=1 Tax=Lewinella sp. IMCC34183 TaxID=2248762 RepID=UPI000E2600D1|nr:glycosyltransferase [Lewinella sp. IMCC34183]
MNLELASILVPVYNAEAYLPALIQSVRVQSYQHWELVFVDDQSTDGGFDYIRAAAAEDDRIRLWQNDENRGPSATLNRAADLARGDLLFRLDADDLMLPERLERQVRFMADHPNVGLLGSAYRNIDDAGQRGNRVGSRITSSDGVKAKFLFANAMGHSTVVYRRRAFTAVGGYNQRLRASLDYDLLARLSLETDCHLLREELVLYRTHNSNITSQQRQLQIQNAGSVQEALLRHYGFSFTAEQLDIHLQMAHGPRATNRVAYRAFLRRARTWLSHLEAENSRLGAFDRRAFAEVIAEVHTRLYARAASPLRLRDYITMFTPNFASLRPHYLVQQVAHTLKNGL